MGLFRGLEPLAVLFDKDPDRLMEEQEERDREERSAFWEKPDKRKESAI